MVLISVVGMAVYLSLAVYSDFGKVAEAFAGFNWFYIPVVIALVLFGYFLRSLRWDAYLKIIGVEMDKRTGFVVFLSGLSMSVTPGKSGELIKSYFQNPLVLFLRSIRIIWRR